MREEADFVVTESDGQTTFEAASKNAEYWLLSSKRVSPDDKRPFAVHRDSPGAAVFLDALNRKGFVCRKSNGEVYERKPVPAAMSGPSSVGCLLIAAAVVLSPPLYLLSRCSPGEPAKPTKEEIAEAKRWEEEDRAREKFEHEQAPLWKQPATNMTASKLFAEMQKCYAAINPPGAPEAYIEGYDESSALASFKADSFVKVTGQRTHPFGGVSVQEYTCYFKGAGFERHSTENVGRKDGFTSD